MFAVYRVDSDGCTYSSDTVLFVTADEALAKNAVDLAEQEKDQALGISRPTWTQAEIKKHGAEFATMLMKEHSEKIRAILTIDVPLDTNYNFAYHVDDRVTYYYEKIAVR